MLKLVAISKQYRYDKIIDQLDLTILPKTTVAISGANGQGKTTLLRLIAGLTVADSGTIYYNDQPMPLDLSVRAVAMSFQSPILWEHLTVKQHILFGCSITDSKQRQQFCQYLANSLGIETILDKKPHQLSGGQAKRVDLARALGKQSPILLLDEPLSHLDKVAHDRTLSFLKTICPKKQVVIVASHDQQLINVLCDRQYSLQNGKLTVEEAL